MKYISKIVEIILNIIIILMLIIVILAATYVVQTKVMKKDYANIIVYRQEDSFITHRVIKINEDTVITKGDANNSEDRQINKNQILGKVIYIIPKVSIWKKVLSTPVVSISIITTILLFGFAFSYEGKESKDK